MKNALVFRLKDLSTDDHNLYFKGAFCKLRVNGTTFWSEVAEAGPGTLYLGGPKALYPSNLAINQKIPIEKVEILSVFPTEGWHNTKKHTFLFRRIAEKQYSKGLCSKNCYTWGMEDIVQAFGYVSHAIKAGYKSVSIVDTDFYSAIEEGVYYPLRDCYRQIYGRNLFARASSVEFCLSQGVRNKNPSLWYREHLIGDMPSSKEIALFSDEFSQECVDAFQPEGIKVNHAF